MRRTTRICVSTPCRKKRRNRRNPSPPAKTLGFLVTAGDGGYGCCVLRRQLRDTRMPQLSVDIQFSKIKPCASAWRSSSIVEQLLIKLQEENAGNSGPN